MSVFAGIDVSTKAIDLVLLDEERDGAQHLRRRLDLPRAAALTRIRRIRDAMPVRGSWQDRGVLKIAIEEPYSRATMGGQVPILMAVGAILQTIPPDTPLELVRADDWRRACDLPIRGEREALKAAAQAFARSHWTNPPAVLDDNAADAYCIAWACRARHTP